MPSSMSTFSTLIVISHDPSIVDPVIHILYLKKYNKQDASRIIPPTCCLAVEQRAFFSQQVSMFTMLTIH